MKKITLLLVAISLLCACKKENAEPTIEETPQTTLWCELWDSSISQYIPLDSSKVELYRLSPNRNGSYDLIYRETVYTGPDGKYTAALGGTNNDYLFVVTSRTYKSTYEAGPHYYEDSVYIHVIDFAKLDTYNHNYLSTDNHTGDRKPGYGSTNYYIGDPLE